MSDNRGPEVAAVVAIFLGASLFFVLLRLFVKTFLTKSWAADDFLLIIAMIFFAVYSACTLAGVHYGTGQRMTAINPINLPKALRFWWLCEMWYTITTVFIRLSVAVFLLRLTSKRLHRWIIYITIAAMLVFSLFYFFLVLFQCSPIHYFWGVYLGVKGKCINPSIVPRASIAHSVISFVVDWILGLLPIAIIYELEMKTSQKYAVTYLLSLGLLAGLATMVRVPYIKTLAITDDWLYYTTDVAIWSTIEPGLGLIAVAGATLRPLFRKFFASTRGYPSEHNSTQLSGWRNSQLGYVKNVTDQSISPQPGMSTSAYSYQPSSPTATYAGSRPQTHDEEQMMSINDITHYRPADIQKPSRSLRGYPLTDSKEAMSMNSEYIHSDAEERQSSKSMGGIQVQRTVSLRPIEDHEDDTEGFIGSEIESGVLPISSRPSTRGSSRARASLRTRSSGRSLRWGERSQSWERVTPLGKVLEFRPGTPASDAGVQRLATARSEEDILRAGTRMQTVGQSSGEGYRVRVLGVTAFK